MAAGCVPVTKYNLESGKSAQQVKFEVVENAGVFSLENKSTKTMGCDKFPDTDENRRGCIVAEARTMLAVSVKLSGSGGWYFSKFQICSVDTPQKPDDFDDCSLTDVERADWLVLAHNGIAMPGTDGRVDIAGFGTGLRQFTLLDYNWTRGLYFYRVQVCPNESSGESDCLWSDPAVENRGWG